MDAWPQRRGLQAMNLRSVFTAEQQRILERYYENGMTNQSKACFQLILQCAQEAKLDFSVVRTWVGNKRRKLAAKVEQNGSVSQSSSSHGIAAGLLSSVSMARSALSNHGLSTGVLLSSDLAANRSIQNRVHFLPPSSSFPSFSTTSSCPSLSSPLSSNNTNNNDVILTGIYSLNSAPRSRPRPPAPQAKLDSERSGHASSSLLNQTLHSKNMSTLVSPPCTLKALTSASGPVVYTAGKKDALCIGEGGVGTGAVPHSWTRQYGTTQNPLWSSSQAQAQRQPKTQSNLQSQPPAPEKVRVSLPVQSTGPSSEQSPRIQQVFTLSEKGEEERLRTAQASVVHSRDPPRAAPHPLDLCHNLSIAMETGNEEDEWQREEELANMGAQTHVHRGQTLASPTGAEVSVVRGNHTPPTAASKAPLQGSYSLTVQTSVSGEPNSQVPVGVSAAPWIINSSRKRTLQDRTQFSNEDLIQLKRFWDRGMTSLGSVCREKITAAADQLNVDTEIVKTWISNRRRKYRLMGIEIPPPKGGPAVFTSPSPGNQSPVDVSPDGERLRTPDLADDLNDGGSVCMSEDGTVDSQHREEDDDTDVSTAAPLANNVKIEVIDEDEEAEEDNDLVVSNLEQMQNLLEFKHEEVQFLENELENQKQRYQELANFTKNLLSAMKNNDLERQQEILASLPQLSDQDWDTLSDPETSPDPEPFIEGPGGILPPEANERLSEVNTDLPTNEVTEPSASEEPPQETMEEQE